MVRPAQRACAANHAPKQSSIAGGSLPMHQLLVDGHLKRPAVVRSTAIAALRGLEHFSHLCRVRRGQGGPRDSRPGGRRYLFFQRPAPLGQAGGPLYTKRQNAPGRINKYILFIAGHQAYPGFSKRQPQVFRLRLPPDHPTDEDLSVGAPGRAANFAQDDTVFLMRTSETGH
jgi:hypothetical protein